MVERSGQMKEKSLLHGAFWGTLVVFLSKVLGFIYLVPFNRMLNKDELFIFSSSYRIYAYVLLIATAGIPFATAKLIAKYNARKRYDISFKLLFSNIKMMFGVGLVCCIGVILLSKPLANIILSNGSIENKDLINSLQIAIMIVSTALILVPIVSVVRGFFQGYKEIKISSSSQLIEQFVSATFIISAAGLLSLNIISSTALVYFSVFCATLASIASLLYLYFKYHQMKDYFKEYLDQTVYDDEISTKQLYKELLQISIPFLSIVLLAQSNDFIDLLFTFNGLLANGYSAPDATNFFGIYSFNITKIMTIPMMISMGLSTALVPHISETLSLKDYKGLRVMIIQILEGSLLALLPLVFLIIALNYEVYYIVAGGTQVEYGASLITIFGFYSIVNVMTIIVDNLMLSLNQSKRALIFISTSTIFKIVSIYFLIASFGVYGLVASSILACLISLVLSLIVIKKVYRVSYADFGIKALKSLAICLLLLVVIRSLANIIVSKNYIFNFAEAGILFFIGIFIYYVLALKFNVIDKKYVRRITSRFKGAK